MATVYSGKSDRNQLELFFDLGSPKSYEGEPTVNIAGNLSNFGPDGSGQGSVGTYTPVDGDNHYRIVDNNSNTRVSRTYTNFTAGVPYTFSVEFKKLTGAPTLRFQLQGRDSNGFVNASFPTTSEIGIEDKDGWQRAKYTFTPLAGSTTLYWFIQDGDDYVTYTHSYELRNPQLEQNNHATQFTEGTRTASLVDLAENNTFDISEVSYNEEGNILFNGTSDHIQTGNFSLDFGTGSFTLEAWVYPFANNTYTKIINKGQSGAFPAPDTDKGYSLRFMNTGATFTVSDGTLTKHVTVQNIDDVPVNKWSHIMGVVDRASGKQNLYINGELNNSADITYGDVSVPSAELTIGSLARGVYGSDSEWFNGQIRTARVYGRAVKPTQVVSNYKATFERVRTEEPGIVQAPPAQVTPPPAPPAGTNTSYMLMDAEEDYIYGDLPANVQSINFANTATSYSIWVSPDWESATTGPFFGFQSADEASAFFFTWNNRNSGFFARFITNNQKSSGRQRWWNPYRSSAATGVSASKGVWSARNPGNTDVFGDREWINLTVTHNPSRFINQGGLKMYWNGQQLTSTWAEKNGFSPNFTPERIVIGAMYPTTNLAATFGRTPGNYTYDGTPFRSAVSGGLDEFKMYDKELTSSEVLALYNAGIDDTNSLYNPIYSVSFTAGANPELTLDGDATFQQH